MLSRSLPRVLVVLCSSNQLYSGTGTALFDWIRVARHALSFTITIDTQDAKNAAIAARFCENTGTTFIPSAANPVAGCPDHGVRSVPRLCKAETWDFIECVSWANAATNLDVLNAIGPSTRLLFTPHTQPLWTLGNHRDQFMVMPVFLEMLERSTRVFIDAPNELDGLQVSEPARQRARYVPLGVDTQTFCYGEAAVERRVLCVCDFREPRKRIDLLVRGFTEAARQDPGISLTIAGNRSENFPIPPGLEGRVSRLGFVPIEELVRQYRSCSVLALLSDYEAFGLPIAEALCSGAPVIIHEQEQLKAVFGRLPGVRIVRNDDTASVSQAMLEAVAETPERRTIARAASERFAIARTYQRKLDHVMSLVEIEATIPEGKPPYCERAGLSMLPDLSF